MSTPIRSKSAKTVTSKIDTGLKDRRPISNRTSAPPSTPKNASTLRKSASTSFATPTRPPMTKTSVSSTLSKPTTRKSVPVSPKSRTSTDGKPKMQRAISTGSVGSIGSSTVLDSNEFDNDFEFDKKRQSAASYGGQSADGVAISHTLPLLCGICKQKVKGPVVCPNRHVFCDACLQEWIKRRPQCPTCKVEISPSTPCLPLVGASLETEKDLDLISTEEMQERRERAVMRKTQLTMIMKDYEEEIATLQMSMLKLKEKCERNQMSEPGLMSASLDPMSPNKRATNTRASPYELLKLSQMEIAELQKTIDKLMDENTRVKLEMAAVIEEASQLKSQEDGGLWSESRSSSPSSSRPNSVISKLSGGPAPAIKLKLALAENSRIKSHVADLERENETLTASLSRNEQYIGKIISPFVNVNLNKPSLEMLQRKIKQLESKTGGTDETFDQEESNLSFLSSKSFEEFKRGEVFT
ncbi:hypothetical protein HK098_001781 [Nowakowskiella sp. JEL0407]|nr:hypothetical protein HK098_001781 [Nowakowskiella sp. JEL0407]